MNRPWLAIAALVVGAYLGPSSGYAADIKVLSAVAVKSSLDELRDAFQQTTGHKVTIIYSTAGLLRTRILGGEFGDVAILPKPAFDPLVAEGKIRADSRVVIARSTVGVSVRSGAPKPDLSSVDAVKRSLRNAKSVVYTDPAQGGLSGIHFVRVLEQLGISEEMKPKTKLTTVASGIGPSEIVAKGEAELAVSQTADLFLNAAGTDYVGPLPAELQNTSDFVFSAGILAEAKEVEAARAFIAYLASENAARVIKAKGMEPGAS
jgi:molybdate transport system substrate-binding protein